MDSALAFFVSFLPRRYWRGLGGLGIMLSGLLQLAVGIGGFVSTYMRFASSVSDDVAAATIEASTDKDTGGRVRIGDAMALGALTPIGFLAVSNIGRIFAYLIFSAVVRLLGYATNHPWGDPVLTFIDDVLHGFKDSAVQQGREATRSAANLWVRGREATRTAQHWWRHGGEGNDGSDDRD